MSMRLIQEHAGWGQPAHQAPERDMIHQPSPFAPRNADQPNPFAGFQKDMHRTSPFAPQPAQQQNPFAGMGKGMHHTSPFAPRPVEMQQPRRQQPQQPQFDNQFPPTFQQGPQMGHAGAMRPNPQPGQMFGNFPNPFMRGGMSPQNFQPRQQSPFGGPRQSPFGMQQQNPFAGFQGATHQPSPFQPRPFTAQPPQGRFDGFGKAMHGPERMNPFTAWGNRPSM